MRFEFLILGICSLILAPSVNSSPRSCGTHWSGWAKTANPVTNPCPKTCVRGERLTERTYGKAPNLQYDVQFQCYFSEPTPATKSNRPEKTVTATQSTSAASTVDMVNVFPFVKGDADDPAARNGAWLNWETRFTPWPNNLKGKENWRPVFEKLSHFVKQSPALSSLREFYPYIQYGVDDTLKPVPRGQISLILWPAKWVEAEPNSTNKIRLKHDAWGSTPGGMDLWINWLPNSPSGSSSDLRIMDWHKDKQGKFFQLEKPERLIDGFPVYGGYLFITASNKPPLFIPVTQQRALQAYMATAKQQMNQVDVNKSDLSEALTTYNSPDMKRLRKQVIEQAGANEKDPKKAAALRAKAERDDAEQERQIREASGMDSTSSPLHRVARKAYDEWERQLRNMNEVERNKPAYIQNSPDDFLGEKLVAANANSAVPLMQYNPAYFNPELGPEVPQLLVMSIGSAKDWQMRKTRLDKLPVIERVPVAFIERTKWSTIQPYLQ